MKTLHSSAQPLPKRLRLRLTRKRQMTLPVEAARYLALSPEHPVELVLVDGKAYLEAASMTLEETYGSVHATFPPDEWKQREAQAKEEHAHQRMQKITT